MTLAPLSIIFFQLACISFRFSTKNGKTVMKKFTARSTANASPFLIITESEPFAWPVLFSGYAVTSMSLLCRIR